MDRHLFNFDFLFKDSYYQSMEVKQRFMAAMHSIAKLTAKDVVTAFDLSQFRSACDLGGKPIVVFYQHANEK